MPYTLRKVKNKRHKIKSRRHKKIKIGGATGTILTVLSAIALNGRTNEQKLQILEENPNRPYYFNGKGIPPRVDPQYLYLGKFLNSENINPTDIIKTPTGSGYTESSGHTKKLIFRPFLHFRDCPTGNVKICLESDGGPEYPNIELPYNEIDRVRYSNDDNFTWGAIGAPRVGPPSWPIKFSVEEPTGPPIVQNRSILPNTELNVDSVRSILYNISKAKLFETFTNKMYPGAPKAIDMVMRHLNINKIDIDSKFTTIYECPDSIPFYLEKIKNIIKNNKTSISSQSIISVMNSFFIVDKYFTCVDKAIF